MTGQLCREGAEEGLAKVHVDVGVNERPAPESDTPAVIASLLWQSHSSVTESRTNNRDNRRSVRCCTVSLGLLAGIIAVFESNLLHFRADEFGVAFRKNLERSITLYLLTGNKSVEDSIPPTSIRNIKTGHNTNEKNIRRNITGCAKCTPSQQKTPGCIYPGLECDLRSAPDRRNLPRKRGYQAGIWNHHRIHCVFSSRYQRCTAESHLF